MERMRYKTRDRARQRRLRQCTDIEDVESLEAEIGAMRLLALEAMEEGNTVLADRLLTGIGKLAKTQVDVQRVRGELFSRATVVRILEDAVHVLGDVVRDRFDGWEDAIDRAADQIAGNVASTRNEDAQ